jgi:hypothetical protein
MRSEIYLVRGVYLKNMFQNIRKLLNLYIFILQIFTNKNNIFQIIINILLKQIKYNEIYNK